MSTIVHTPWADATPPTETELRRRLIKEGMEPSRWSNASGDRYGVDTHDAHRVIYCVEGDIWFQITDEHDRTIELQPGDRLEIPPGVRHSAMAGMDGVTCLEGRR